MVVRPVLAALALAVGLASCGDGATSADTPEPTATTAAPSSTPTPSAASEGDAAATPTPSATPTPAPTSTPSATPTTDEAPSDPATEEAAATGGCDRDAREVTTTVTDFAFDPADRDDLCVGDTIVFANEGGVAHTASNRGGAFDTGSIAPGAQASVTLDQTGDTSYVCLFHGQMTGTLTVAG